MLIKSLYYYKHKKCGRNQKGFKVFRRSGKKYNKTFFFKINITKFILNSPVYIRKFLIKKIKTSYCSLNIGSIVKTIIPINNFKYVGYLFYKTINNNFINTLKYFNFGSKVSWIVSGNHRIATSLGTFCTIFYENFERFIIILPSGYLKLVNINIIALQHKYLNKNLIKYYSGFKKLKILGKKSTVRGIAKNANDHPHGGRTNGVLRPMTPWGKNIKKVKNKKIKHNSTQ